MNAPPPPPRAPGWIRRLLGWRRPLAAFYHPDYRLPLSGLEGGMAIEPRRADFAAWFLLDKGALRIAHLHSPPRIAYADLARVHSADYLESLARPETLARIFAVDPADVPVDEVLHTLRLACGGTLAAARTALELRCPVMNLLGGFHHAGPERGGGLCALNDVAVAIAALRAEAFDAPIAVIDLDAHPPDGTAACLRADRHTWIASISASDWGGLEGVDEVLLPARSGDEVYLAALAALLARMPAPGLAFVLAGGDVLAGDKLGMLALSLDGARRRDLAVAEALADLPSVWLPAGGYHGAAWRVLAGTGLALARGTRRPIPDAYDPMAARFRWISTHLPEGKLRGGFDLTAADVEEALGVTQHRTLLRFYTAEGVEYALHRYGVLPFLARLGFSGFRVSIDSEGVGDRARLFARWPAPAASRDAAPANEGEHVLIETALEKQELDGKSVLFVHWLTLCNPRAHFTEQRPRLPGQEHPGLGIAREMDELFAVMARRLDLRGIAFRPAHYHVAYAARHHFRFVDPLRQARFEALLATLAGRPLLEATVAVAEGRVLVDGKPYAWEADPMVYWLGRDGAATGS